MRSGPRTTIARRADALFDRSLKARRGSQGFTRRGGPETRYANRISQPPPRAFFRARLLSYFDIRVYSHQLKLAKPGAPKHTHTPNFSRPWLRPIEIRKREPASTNQRESVQKKNSSRVYREISIVGRGYHFSNVISHSFSLSCVRSATFSNYYTSRPSLRIDMTSFFFSLSLSLSRSLPLPRSRFLT